MAMMATTTRISIRVKARRFWIWDFGFGILDCWIRTAAGPRPQHAVLATAASRGDRAQSARFKIQNPKSKIQNPIASPVQAAGDSKHGGQDAEEQSAHE